MKTGLRMLVVLVSSIGVVSCAVPDEHRSVAVSVVPLTKPNVKSMNDAGDLYPNAQLRLGHTGYALIEYSIDDRGRARQLQILEATDPAFGEAASRQLQAFNYAVPSTWKSTGGPEQRFQIQFHFTIRGYPNQGGHSGIEDIVISGNPAEVQR